MGWWGRCGLLWVTRGTSPGVGTVCCYTGGYCGQVPCVVTLVGTVVPVVVTAVTVVPVVVTAVTVVPLVVTVGGTVVR